MRTALACWAWVPLEPGNIPRAQSLRGRAANPQAHHRQSGRLGMRCISKRSWSLLNWLIAEITSLLLQIKLLFRNLRIYALFLGNWVWRVFGPTLFLWLLKNGNGAEKIISPACVCTHTHTHIHTLSKHCTWVTMDSNVLASWEQFGNCSILNLQMFSWAVQFFASQFKLQSRSIYETTLIFLIVIFVTFSKIPQVFASFFSKNS